MRVLITGVTGFIGNHLAAQLIDEGHEVFAVVRPASDVQSLLQPVRQRVQFITLDVNSTMFDLMSELNANGTCPDMVYHLASLYLTNHHQKDIGDLIASNITLGTELLEAMVAHGVNKFVWAGTSWQHYHNEPYSPVNLYAATKEAFAAIVKYYREAFGLRDICLQLFDTYGVCDRRKKLIHLLLEASETGEALAMSPGYQQIDLVHIDDVVNAFIIAGKCLDKEGIGTTYAVSSGTVISLRNLVKIIESISQKPLNILWGGRPYREREVMLPWQNGERLPDWQPKIKLEDGLRSLLKL